MGNPNDSLRLDFGVDTDDSSFRNADKRLDKLDKNIRDSGKSATVAGRALTELGQDAAKGAQAAIDDLQAMRRELVGIGDAADKARTSTSKVGGGLDAGGFASRTGQLRGAAGTLAGLGGGNLGAVGGALEATQAIGEMAEALPSLSKNLGGATTALGALTAAGLVIVNALQQNAAKIESEFSASLNSAQEYFTLIRTSSQEEIDARLDALKIQKASNDDYLAYLDNLKTEIQASGGVVGDAIEGLNALGISTTEYSAALQALDKEIQEAKTTAAGLNADENNLTKARGKVPATNAEAADSEQELAAARGDTANATDKAAKEAEQAAATQAREAEKARAAQEKAAEDAARKAEETANKIIAANTKYANAVEDIGTDLARSIRDASIEARREAVNLTKDLNREIAKAGRAANDAQLELDTDYYRERAKLERDTQRQLKNIIRQANREQQDLLAARDFLAADLLTKQTKREIEDTGGAANAAAEEQKIAREEAFEDLQGQIEIERRERLIAFREQKADLGKALREQTIDLRRAANDRITDATTALNRELELAQQGANALIGVESQLWQARIGLAQQGMAALGAAPIGGGGGGVNLTINGANMSTNQMRTVALDVMSRVGVAG